MSTFEEMQTLDFFTYSAVAAHHICGAAHPQLWAEYVLNLNQKTLI